jgi:hypothetical protein
MRTDVPSPFKAPLMTLNLAAVATASQNAFQKKINNDFEGATDSSCFQDISVTCANLALTFGQR